MNILSIYSIFLRIIRVLYLSHIYIYLTEISYIILCNKFNPSLRSKERRVLMHSSIFLHQARSYCAFRRGKEGSDASLKIAFPWYFSNCPRLHPFLLTPPYQFQTQSSRSFFLVSSFAPLIRGAKRVVSSFPMKRDRCWRIFLLKLCLWFPVRPFDVVFPPNGWISFTISKWSRTLLFNCRICNFIYWCNM